MPDGLIARAEFSAAQAETLIDVTSAHVCDLPGRFDPEDKASAEGSIYRQGYFLGDGTGAGKGRQVASVILVRWVRGERRHIWISKNEALLEDARRDWTALGALPIDIQPLSSWKLGSPIGMREGIHFATWYSVPMKRKMALAAPTNPSASKLVPEGEIITVLAPGEVQLPKRRARPGLSTAERFVAVLSSLVDSTTVVAKVNFTKALEARSSATLRAMTCDLESYALFASGHTGAGLPASAERLVEWIDHLEASRQKPATIARKLATVATVHGLLGAPSAVSSSLVRDTMKGLRRRQGKGQRQAAGLRLGEAIGSAPIKGFTLAALMEACGNDLPGLRDAALLSLGYDAGLRVSELLEATVEALEVQDDGSGLLDINHSKTDQEGQGATVWVSSETMRRIALWRETASIRKGPMFRRVGVIRTKGHSGRRALAIADLAYNASVDRERMAAISARQASVTFSIGDTALTVAAVRSIIRKRALAAADMGLGRELIKQVELDAAA